MARKIRQIEWASPQQKELFECGPSPTLMIGGFNAAKTFGAVLKLLYLLDKFPNSRAAVVRASSKDIRRTIMQTFYALCPPSAYKYGRRSDQDMICVLNNGSTVYFMHLDKPDSINVLAGLELNFGLVDQAEQIPENAFDTLDSRLGRWSNATIAPEILAQYDPWPWLDQNDNPVPPPFMFMTANPPESEDHWLFVRFADESDERARWAEQGYKLIRASSDSNRFASKANLDKLKSKDPEFVRRFFEGRWGNPQGYIFDIPAASIVEANPHLLKRIINTMNLSRSMDHGDSNPTCVLWHGVDHDENVFVYREYYQPNRLVSEHRQSVFELSARDIPDNSMLVWPDYRHNVADPSIFAVSRGRSSTTAPTWSVADEWTDTHLMPKETAVYWRPAPLPKTENKSYELTTRSRIKEYLKVDPRHRNPITGEMGAPHIYFLKKSDDYPNGCHFVIKELRGQRRVKIGEREGRAIYSDDRDENIVDHAYDTVKYFLIGRPGIAHIANKVDPNVINIRELMDWTADNARRRAKTRGGY